MEFSFVFLSKLGFIFVIVITVFYFAFIRPNRMSLPIRKVVAPPLDKNKKPRMEITGKQDFVHYMHEYIERHMHEGKDHPDKIFAFLRQNSESINFEYGHQCMCTNCITDQKKEELMGVAANTYHEFAKKSAQAEALAS